MQFKALFFSHVLCFFTFFSSNILAEIEEVIVVAEKRSESLQDVSQAVTAITSSELEIKNITHEKIINELNTVKTENNDLKENIMFYEKILGKKGK